MKKPAILRAIALLFLFGMFFGPGASSAMPAEPTEPEIKAAFVFHFIKFVDWSRNILLPEDLAITLCVLGQDPLEEALQSLTGKIVQGKSLSVRRITRPREADGCQVLYISRSEKEQVGNILKGIKEGVLTIGDMQSFASTGGIINFVIVENRVSFEINVDAAEKARLRISSQLLKLAKIVKEGSGKEKR